MHAGRLPRDRVAGLEPGAVRAYLARHGWEPTGERLDHVGEVLRRVGRPEMEILVPLDRTPGDYVLRMADVVRALAGVEGRHPAEVLDDLSPPIPIDPLDHQGLVRSIARQLHRRYRLRHLDIEDLVSAGQFGLLRAIALFDPSLQERFDAYAQYWIRHSIQVEICDRELLMRVPPYQWKPRGYDPHAARSRAKFRAAVDRARSTASLDAPAGDGPGANEALVDWRTPAPDAGLVREALRRALETLPAAERRVVEARYGLDGGEPRLGREVAEVLGVTRQRVSKIESRALARLRAILGGEARP